LTATTTTARSLTTSHLTTTRRWCRSRTEEPVTHERYSSESIRPNPVTCHVMSSRRCLSQT
jgi:hypothetical protein